MRRHVFTLSAGNILGQAITLAALPLLSRIYGPAAFGFLALYLSVSTLVSVVATGRYELALLLPESRHDAITLKKLARRLLWGIAFCTLVVVTIYLGPLADLLNAREFRYWLLTIPLNVVLLGEISILNHWHTRSKGFGTQSLNRIILAGTTAVFQIGLGVWVLDDARGLIVGVLSAQIIAWIFLSSRVGISRAESRTIRYRDLHRMLIRYSKMPLLNAPTALLDSVRTNGVNFIVGNISVAELGQFSMASRTVQSPMSLVGAALGQVFFQQMSRENNGNLTRIVTRTTSRVMLVSLPLSTAAFFALPAVLPFLLGPEWSNAGLYAQALIPWLCINLATAPISTIFVVAEAQGRQAVFGVIYTSATLLALLIAGPNVLAAVWAMSLTMTTCLIGFFFLAVVTARQYDQRRTALEHNSENRAHNNDS